MSLSFSNSCFKNFSGAKESVMFYCCDKMFWPTMREMWWTGEEVNKWDARVGFQDRQWIRHKGQSRFYGVVESELRY
jgi:hypothetical protein